MSNFRDYEFRCPHCEVALVRPRLQERLETLRHLIGDKPIRIVSGYRCPVHNKAVGGAPDSQHMYAAAADIPSGLVKFAQAMRAGFTGIGTKGDWVVHVDVRDGALRHWTY
jgi:zinc D-Ala-D-Ala carboxypeptidase